MKLRTVLIPAVVLAIALALVLVILRRWNAIRSTAGLQKIDDAYVHANIVPLSTRVSDMLRTLTVNDYQRVEAGQLLAQLDDTDYKADVARAEAQLAASQASLADNQVQKQVQSARIAQVGQQVEEAMEAAGAAAANVHAAEAQVERADQERHRQEILFADRATTKQTLERAVADAEQQHSSLDSAHSDLSKAEAAVVQARVSVTEAKRELQLLASKDRDFAASIGQQRASVRAALVQLGYTRIYAPVNGIVGERTVFPGQLVSPGMDVIDGWLRYSNGVGQPVLAPKDVSPPLARGYATFGSDSGHHRPRLCFLEALNLLDASFADAREERRNYSRDAIKKAHDVALGIMKRRYGRAPTRMFFLGGSTGGHEALTAIQHWPADYDGVLSAYPDWTGGQLALKFISDSQALYARGGFLSRSNTKLLARSVLDACDAEDGVRDGLVSM